MLLPNVNKPSPSKSRSSSVVIESASVVVGAAVVALSVVDSVLTVVKNVSISPEPSTSPDPSSVTTMVSSSTDVEDTVVEVTTGAVEAWIPVGESGRSEIPSPEVEITESDEVDSSTTVLGTVVLVVIVEERLLSLVGTLVEVKATETTVQTWWV